MPTTNHIIDLFLGKDTQTIKTVAARARPEDVKLVQEVFPEAGVTSYLTGLIYKKLADELRREEITNVGERHKVTAFMNLSNLKNSIQINTQYVEPEE